MRAFVVFGLALAGCSFQHGSLSRDDAPVSGDDDAPMIDAAIDARPDARPDATVTPTCSPTGLVCLAGIASAMTCNGACWVKCTIDGTSGTPVTEATAGQLCANWGGKLAPIRNAMDQACVATTLFPGQASWIGFEQAPATTTVAGGWSWNGDNVTPTYTNWDTAGNQPDDQNGSENGQEQCAFMPTTGLWHDTDCFGTLYRFSCRK
ncbi:MAG TPA: C-type lectin domain-containing protein [Kofleriaceae bacterium]|nr:C-type lectin domain-containing protein [Kofleriaceae bacterium]